MDTSEIIVVIGAAVLVALTLWYFFGPRERIVASIAGSGVQEVNIAVKGGYAPDLIVVKRNRPVRLNFYRDETASCSEELVIREFGISQKLPAFKTTAIEFTPNETGEFPFTCGMAMMRGRIIVEDAGGGESLPGDVGPS